MLKKQRTGLFDFLSKKAKSLRIVDVVPNPHSEPGKPLYERFLSAYVREDQEGQAPVPRLAVPSSANQIVMTSTPSTRRQPRFTG